MTTQDVLSTALWEADRHLATLEAAQRDWQAAPAANLAVLETDREKLRILDQLLFRFTIQGILRLLQRVLPVLEEESPTGSLWIVDARR